MKDHPPSITRTLLFLLWGPIVWGVQFTLSYGGHTLLCAQGASPVASQWGLAGLALLALIAIAPVAFRSGAVAARLGVLPTGGEGGFVVLVARLAAILSLIAVPWTAAGALMLQACIQGR
ncbi:hypothetical protein [Niveispirillum sp.]|uniref:hypothetical protein n=1 Tax=Niveispirillum sp. TaxID=1917217 RepID=UPI001B70EF1B|nr:hypothetical protein [Niveispirillum sp.]MBP7338965.1 hypothetical protein [Niveispirillum sp.]